MSGSFRSPLVYEPSRTRVGFYRLTEPFGYSSGIYRPGFTVPIGFETDFASHPKNGVLNWISRRLLGTLKGARWAVVHDYAYRVLVANRLLTRQDADRLMDEAMRADDIPWFKRMVINAGVRANSKRREAKA